MDYRRRPSRRSSHNRKPPLYRGKSPQSVPYWEKQFCKVVGQFDWATIVHLQASNHLYDNIIKWDDSAGAEAFNNAKKRFWAEVKGLSCDVELPDPNLFIDEVNWDSATDLELHEQLESNHVICSGEEHHEPVIIFGDALTSNQDYTPAGWGIERHELQGNSFSKNDNDLWGSGWPELGNNTASNNQNDQWGSGWPELGNNTASNNQNDQWGSGWPDLGNNTASNNHNDQWGSGWGNPGNNTSNFGQTDYYYSNNNAWDFSGNNGYATWENGWNGGWGQTYANNNYSYELGPYREDKRDARGWNDGWGDNYGYNNFSYEGGRGSDDKRAGGANEHWNNHDNATGNNSSSYRTSRYKKMPVKGTRKR